jgi:hypothetical protein
MTGVRRVLGRSAAVAMCAAAASGSGLAGDASADAVPFVVEGYRYSFVQPVVHMFVCEAARCKEGSKVSYVVAHHSKVPTFVEYQAMRRKIAMSMAERMPEGTFTFVEPVDSSDGDFKIYTAERVQRSGSQPDVHTFSTSLIGAQGAFEIISTSSDRTAADANMTEFKRAAMMVAGRQKP